jgi:hypothetical protein
MYDIASKILEGKRREKEAFLYPYSCGIISLFSCVDFALTCILVYPVYESKICTEIF